MAMATGPPFEESLPAATADSTDPHAAHPPPPPRPIEDSPYIRKLRDQPMSPADPAIHLAYRGLLEQFEQLLAAEPAAAQGLHHEGVHQMRVATRRLRASFRAFTGILPPKPINAFNRQFRWLAAALGKVRDLDVYLANLQRYAADLPLVDAEHLAAYKEHLHRQWRQARTAWEASLASRRYARLKERFTRFLQRGPTRADIKAHEGVTIADAARQLIAKRHRRLRRDGRAIAPDSSESSLHALRIQVKRLRYLFDFFAPAYGNALKPYLKPLRKLQDILGDYQDANVATARLRAYADRIPTRAGHRRQLLALGQLISSQRRLAESSRTDFKRAWKRFDRKGGRKALLATLTNPPPPTSETDPAAEQNPTTTR